MTKIDLSVYMRRFILWLGLHTWVIVEQFCIIPSSMGGLSSVQNIDMHNTHCFDTECILWAEDRFHPLLFWWLTVLGGLKLLSARFVHQNQWGEK